MYYALYPLQFFPKQIFINLASNFCCCKVTYIRLVDPKLLELGFVELIVSIEIKELDTYFEYKLQSDLKVTHGFYGNASGG